MADAAANVANVANVDEERSIADFSENEDQKETDDEKLEKQHFWKVVEAFLNYK